MKKITRSCNNCGQCCNETPCVIALVLVSGSKKGARCPALEQHDDKFLCGFYLDPFRYYNIDWASNISDKNLINHINNTIIKDIPKAIGSAFSGKCDTNYGTGTKDLRIPVKFI